MKYKDKCDKCGKWDICKGINNLALCQKCYQEYTAPKTENKSSKKNVKQISLF